MVGNPAATVMTSSPGFSLRSPSFGEVRAVNASRFADDPEFTREAQRTPTNFASFRSKSSANRPVVNQASSAESTTEHTSSPSITLPEHGDRRNPRLELRRRKDFGEIPRRKLKDLLSKPLTAISHRGPLSKHTQSIHRGVR